MKQIKLTNCKECGTGVQVMPDGSLKPVGSQVMLDDRLIDVAKLIHNGLYGRQDRDNWDYIGTIVDIIKDHTK